MKLIAFNRGKALADGVANTHATTHATKRMKTQKQAMQSMGQPRSC